MCVCYYVVWCHNHPESQTDYFEETKLRLYCNHLVNILVAQAKNLVILASFLFLTPCMQSTSRAWGVNPLISPQSLFSPPPSKLTLPKHWKEAWMHNHLLAFSPSFYPVSSLFSTQQKHGPFKTQVTPHYFPMFFNSLAIKTKVLTMAYKARAMTPGISEWTSHHSPGQPLHLITHWIWHVPTLEL